MKVQIKAYEKTLPQNYTPAKRHAMCGIHEGARFGCAAKQYMHKPSGLGITRLNDFADALFEQENNETAKGVELDPEINGISPSNIESLFKQFMKNKMK